MIREKATGMPAKINRNIAGNINAAMTGLISVPSWINDAAHRARAALRPPIAGSVRSGRLQSADRKATLEAPRSEENTSELQSLMRIAYPVFCLNTKTITTFYKHKYAQRSLKPSIE